MWPGDLLQNLSYLNNMFRFLNMAVVEIARETAPTFVEPHCRSQYIVIVVKPLGTI